MIDGDIFERALKELVEQKARERREAIEAGLVVDLQARRVEIERKKSALRVSQGDVSENARK